ncbi:hypothetical protein FRC06_007589 [Ceratobasidium sp. 370]|nr:hypothetical protein FRC06_007589 [Ceratobasidium sp. 370]
MSQPLVYSLATPRTRSRTPAAMAKALDQATNETKFWDVLAMNGKADKPMPPVYDPTQTYSSEDIPLHPLHAEAPNGFGIDGVDVFIAGSGPVGATYARKLVNAGLSVVMCEMGGTDTRPAASHKKNEIEYQKDIDRFVNVIKAALSPVSVPTSKAFVDTLDPASWNYDKPFVTNGKNPKQKEAVNLSAQAVTRGTGGMATHWTCAVPHFLKGLERPVIDPRNPSNDDKEWKELYEGAGELIYRSESEFDKVSMRHTLVLNTLNEEPIINAPPTEPHQLGPSSITSPLQPQPRAEAQQTPKQWMSAESVFGDLIMQQHVFPGEREAIGLPSNLSPPRYQGKFRLLPNHRVTRYALKKGSGAGETGTVVAAEVQDLMADRANRSDPNAPVHFYIKAKYFVTACGAVATPQVLYNSGFNSFEDKDPNAPRPPHKFKKNLLPALGKYITEQPMSFCQVVLKKSLVDMVPSNPWNLDWWDKAYTEHLNEDEDCKFKDPLPFRVSAFSYGAVAQNIDSRLVVDFRWFGCTQPVETNYITFERDMVDAYGMPQPTFNFVPDEKSVDDAHRMMTDMCEVAQKIGGYLPGSEPQFMAPGLALHLGGTTRLGHDVGKSCANFRGQVHGFPNLYVAGNGVIDTPFAANPTLTSMALAIYSAEDIANKEGDRVVKGWKEEGGKLTEVDGTAKDLFKRVVKRARKRWNEVPEVQVPEVQSATSTQPDHVPTDTRPLLGKPTPSLSNSRPVAVARGPTAPTRGNNNDTPGPSTSKQPAPASSSFPSASSSAGRPPIPAPRPTRLTPAPRVGAVKRPLETLSPAPSPPPPAKVPKVTPGLTSLSATGAPILNINAANTNVPLKERQKMVTVIYETFRTLYSDIPSSSQTATLPGQHAIAQEAEIYAKSQRRTYKINGAHTITMIKKRPKPNRISHPSCTYHWGRTYMSKAAGMRELLYRCCGAPGGSPGCVVGPHVFKDPEDFDLLHARHPYSPSSAFEHARSPQPPQPGTPLDIAALDCEMIYTTAGMSLARVSVIDGAGKSVYDKLVRPDVGVGILDYNTRFSGVKSLAEAELDLDGVRRELRKLIGPETILIGHALENDMRALRMVHLNVVDTTVLFPHPSGFPYRRALRDLARDHLGLLIQNSVEGAETQGHSSLEDAVATLDLVKFWVQEQKRKTGRVSVS